MKEENKRRIVLINRRFQFGLIIRFIMVNILILGIFGGFLYLFLDNEIQANLNSAHVVFANMKHMMGPIVVTLSIINIIVSSIFISIFVLFSSHRIAGPLYRFKTVIEEVCKRNLQPLLALRKKDELFPLSDILGEMIAVIKSDAEEIRGIQVRLASINRELGNDELEAEIGKLEAFVNRYQY